MSSEIGLLRPQAREERLMHPVEFIQRSAPRQEEAARMNNIRSTHGLGAATEVALTEVTLLGSRRLGALPTSNTLYHAYRGNFTELNPSDVYGLPEHDPNVQPAPRALVEKQFHGHELTMKTLGL
ncbi:Proteasome maturation factor UMP1 [Novymonas esmeraldas]|uniref:Proteasome maturation factor UMP1 n=1 Tax=Novymonas esmeraldas TaxID=1808958 RepID=A0AAW0ENQ2_9TRYP